MLETYDEDDIFVMEPDRTGYWYRTKFLGTTCKSVIAAKNYAKINRFRVARAECRKEGTFKYFLNDNEILVSNNKGKMAEPINWDEV